MSRGWGREELVYACAQAPQECPDLVFDKPTPPTINTLVPFREVEVLAELSTEVESESIACCGEDLVTVFPHQGGESETHAKPNSASVIQRKELESIGQEVQQDIFHWESQMAERENPFTYEEHTGNLQGDFDLSRFSGKPKLKHLLQKYQDIFGPLPPPWFRLPACSDGFRVKG